MHKLLVTTALILASTLALPALADIYVYRDENGVLNYTNMKPISNRYRIDVVYREPKSSASSNLVRVSHGSSRGNGRGVRAVRPPAEVDAIVERAAAAYQVDKALVRAIIQAESGYNPYAISAKGARGLMQLMPATAERYGVRNTFDPQDNILGGVRYMRDLLVLFGQDVRLALAAYNAGENAVQRYGGIPPYRETQDYVQKVLQLHSGHQNI